MVDGKYASTNLICDFDGPKGLNNNSRGRSPWLNAPPPAFLREPRPRRGSRRIKTWVPLVTPSFTGGYPRINPFGVVTLGAACYPQFHCGLSTDQSAAADWYKSKKWQGT